MTDSNRTTYELIATVALPTIIMVFLAGPERLGPTLGLLAGLAFPLGWGIYTMAVDRKVSALAVISTIGVLLTGSVGLLELDPSWFAVKEMVIPFLIGGLTMASAPTRFALLPVMLERLLDPERLEAALGDHRPAYEAAARRGTVIAGAIIAAGGVLSYALARYVVTSPGGTPEFVAELGTHTTLSFFLIGLPTSIGIVFVVRDILVRLEKLTGVDPETLFRTAKDA